jgi:hypothetical protein
VEKMDKNIKYVMRIHKNYLFLIFLSMIESKTANQINHIPYLPGVKMVKPTVF